ncbi:hypothetical protein OUZ56_011126 [Daphnia magna]|uniref:Uncharacterized protein n=1 Tax=Daphnia magna TaxID=35525 RepID=A0ABQ9Z0L9_9CRUS|nr:hypothetical protein OUZ56_011126 [Daphnia magna]
MPLFFSRVTEVISRRSRKPSLDPADLITTVVLAIQLHRPCQLPMINLRLFFFLIIFKLIVFAFCLHVDHLHLPSLSGSSSLPVFKLIIFASRLRFPSSRWSSLPHRHELIDFAVSPLIAPVFASSPSSWSLMDRRRCSTPWLIDHGVGQSPCALGRRRQCTSRDFPLSMRWWSTWGVHSRKGLHCQVSPDLSSDKSPFHRIPQKRCVATVVEQPTGCNGLAANGQQSLKAEFGFSIQSPNTYSLIMQSALNFCP